MLRRRLMRRGDRALEPCEPALDREPLGVLQQAVADLSPPPRGAYDQLLHDAQPALQRQRGMGRKDEEPADLAVPLRHEHRVAGRLAQQLERPLQRLLAHGIAEVRDQGDDVGHVVGSGLADPDRGTHAVTYTRQRVSFP
jgi:hypothetical protein